MSLEIKLEDLSKANKSISVVLRPDKLEELRNRILSNHKSIRKFSKIIGCCDTSLQNILKGRSNPTLLLIQKITRVLNLELTDLIEKVISKGRPRGCFIPIAAFPIKESTGLASLVGHSFGDGHVGNGVSFTNKSEALIKDVKKKVQELPTKNVSINENFYKALTIKFPCLVRDILYATGAPIGNKIKKPFEIPQWIKGGFLEIKRSFIQAIFDDESTVQVTSREIILHFHKTIELLSNLQRFLEEIITMLEGFGIKGATITHCHPHEGKNGKTLQKRLRICGTFNFIKFRENIGFTHSNKERLLNIMIQNTQRFQLRCGEGKTKIIEILKPDFSLNTLQITKSLGISHMATLEHLRELEKRGLIKRTIPNNHRSPHLWHLNQKSFF